MGIGVIPATDFIDGIPLADDGSILVDDHLSTLAGIYAAGDIARFRNRLTGEESRIEHWVVAEHQGRIAALNMLGQGVRYRWTPYFWTVQYDIYLMLAGYAVGWDAIVVEGDIAKREFLTFYLKKDKILAAAGVGRDQDIAAISELLYLDRMPHISKVRAGGVDFGSLLTQPGAGPQAT